MCCHVLVQLGAARDTLQAADVDCANGEEDPIKATFVGANGKDDPEEYKQFLEERAKAFAEEQMQDEERAKAVAEESFKYKAILWLMDCRKKVASHF